MQEHGGAVPSPAFSRRQFLGTAGATGVGLGLGSGLLTSAAAAADSGGSAVLPRPIPSGFLTPVGVFIHHHLPGRGIEASQITDFRSEEHTSELQSLTNLVCRLLLEKKKYVIQQTCAAP